MDQRSVIDKAKRDLEFLQSDADVLGIILYGSWATEEGHEKSDIDICIVAPSARDKVAFMMNAISAVHDDRYDIRIFELLSLYLKMAVIEKGIVIFARDIYELYEYFYPFRRIWEDQKHRQMLSRDELKEMLGKVRSEEVSHWP